MTKTTTKSLKWIKGFLSEEKAKIFTIVLIGIATQGLWVWGTLTTWGWDSFGYLAIGRMYLGIPHEMWSLKYYYPPGVSFLMIGSGVYHLDTLFFYKALVFLMSSTMPLLLYYAVKPFCPPVAVSIFMSKAVCWPALMVRDRISKPVLKAKPLLLGIVAVTASGMVPLFLSVRERATSADDCCSVPKSKVPLAVTTAPASVTCRSL
jgi:hypothetical protein